MGEVKSALCLLPGAVTEMPAFRSSTGVVGGKVVVEGGSNGRREEGEGGREGRREEGREGHRGGGMDRQRKLENVNANYI